MREEQNQESKPDRFTEIRTQLESVVADDKASVARLGSFVDSALSSSGTAEGRRVVIWHRTKEITPTIKQSFPSESSVHILKSDLGTFFYSQPTRNVMEFIVRRTGRPALTIVNGTFSDLQGDDVITSRMLEARLKIDRAIPIVGRVELQSPTGAKHLGSGWLVENDVIVTNRHVAEIFLNGGQAVSWKPIPPYVPALNFNARAVPQPDPLTLEVTQVIHVEPTTGPDIALLRIQTSPDFSLNPSIELLSSDLGPHDDIAVIGYPALDDRSTWIEEMQAYFGPYTEDYGIKRVSPGKVLNVGSIGFDHDATTLGGSSGSLVLDLATGAAAGIHFGGRQGVANSAVKSSVLLPILLGYGIKPRVVNRQPIRHLAFPPIGDAATDPREPEATAKDLLQRQGFDELFLGGQHRVPLPQPGVWQQDVETFSDGGQTRGVLHYLHHSIAMSRSRKLCLWSAVNIDGTRRQAASRPKWKLDPRIPADAQTSGEVYGSYPKFSRGHMTRRQDSVWGTEEEAAKANSDTMYYTNAVPQMQTFNAGIWNRLEDYALTNANRDGMRISVMTGPIFKSDDPVHYGVKVPRSFWKIIAFIHDETGELSVSSYVMDQNEELVSMPIYPQEELKTNGEKEHTFGDIIIGGTTWQVAVSYIEHLTELDFGPLRTLDVFAGQEGLQSLESVSPAIALIDAPNHIWWPPYGLQGASEIRWLRDSRSSAPDTSGN